ncbi:low-temperature viability protein ltv1 [Teratosphaeria destructans]|uniref:Low-temperature viability protein ltv1 n=1 Tax=Teratosphaeria destructans TaxID=418781 RepID=A0A9W7W3W6_9PEZI|nr:low-temperature viability protein ltv1 [Teratosphaeria destructans]
MPRQNPFSKKTATTFTLVHRPQNDPLIHDENAPSMVLAEKQSTAPRPSTDADDADDFDSQSLASGTTDSRRRKTRRRGDLEEEFGLAFRPHEGQAAQHGVFFDDTQYDYMQHMRDLGGGGGGGAVTWVEASMPQEKRGKGKLRLEDALRSTDDSSVGGDSVASSARSLWPEDVLPSEFVRKTTYQDQQDVPDEIAGFQPDMDPRLREVLEALEDEEYVDDEDDIFGELTKDGYEVDRDEWDRLGEQQVFDDEDDGWESDDTIRAASPSLHPASALQTPLPDGSDAKPPDDVQAPAPADPTDGAWLDEFKKFKSDAKAARASDHANANPATPSALDASVMSSLASGRRKKRKGAKTSTTNYSMTSSALARTDQQSLLDDRFDKMLDKEDAELDEIAEEDESAHLPDNTSLASGMTGLSQASRISKYSHVSGLSGISGISSYSRATDSEAPQLVRTDFDGIMDEFLGSHSRVGKVARHVKKGGPQTGMEQLDEVRRGLGPARLGGKKTAVKGRS